MDNISMPTSGPLLRVTLLADASIALGTNLTATVTGCEFTRTADSNDKCGCGVNHADAGSKWRQRQGRQDWLWRCG